MLETAMVGNGEILLVIYTHLLLFMYALPSIYVKYMYIKYVCLYPLVSYFLPIKRKAST